MKKLFICVILIFFLFACASTQPVDDRLDYDRVEREKTNEKIKCGFSKVFDVVTHFLIFPPKL
jgi:thioredoxin-related protein